jgi:hypothetical protein
LQQLNKEQQRSFFRVIFAPSDQKACDWKGERKWAGGDCRGGLRIQFKFGGGELNLDMAAGPPMRTQVASFDTWCCSFCNKAWSRKSPQIGHEKLLPRNVVVSIKWKKSRKAYMLLSRLYAIRKQLGPFPVIHFLLGSCPFERERRLASKCPEEHVFQA